MKTPLRILIVEDQRIVREGLAAIFEDEPDIEIVGSVADGMAALTAYPQLQPDIVLMDLQMPQLDGAETTRRLRLLDTNACILVLTTYALDEYIFNALRAGARGYLLKDASAAELIAAVHAVANGTTHLSPQVAARLAQNFANGSVEPLTTRERQVLLALAHGRTNEQIARELHIGLRTVKTHLHHLMAKLGAANRTELLSTALRRGLVNLPE
jgi:two-component system, NarL family, response regulator LiaR